MLEQLPQTTTMQIKQLVFTNYASSRRICFPVPKIDTEKNGMPNRAIHEIDTNLCVHEILNATKLMSACTNRPVLDVLPPRTLPKVYKHGKHS